MYGPFTNEILLANALKGRRDQITLATKFGVSRGEDGNWRGIRGSADYVKASCDGSLKRLGTDCIDLPTVQRLDIGFVAYSPLGRGFLSGAIQSRGDLEPGDWRLENPRFAEEAIARNSRLADGVAEVAEEIEATAAQVALAWVLSRHDSLVAIPGTRRTGRLEENWAAQDITLRTEHLDRLESLISQGVAGERF